MQWFVSVKKCIVPPRGLSRPPSPRGLPGPSARGRELTSSRPLLPPVHRFRVAGVGRFSRCGVGGLAGMMARDPPPSPAARKRLPLPRLHTRGRRVRASGPQGPFPGGGPGGEWASKGHALLSTGLLARGSSSCDDEGPGPGLRRPSFLGLISPWQVRDLEEVRLLGIVSFPSP